MPAKSNPATDRQIRIFLSSTFRDMHAEREELVKRIFPQLRKRCELRGVTWGEVDLRWGIPDEQKAEGQVLPICLAEIQRCRPYFIGLLGERYGWIPDEIPQELIEQEPWLAEHRQHSVTALEILHGVLNNPAMADHALFYFRDPACRTRVPAGADPADFAPEDATAAAKLRQLKERIRNSGFPVRDNYPDPKALGELVLRDLTEIIDRRYPEEETPDPLDREAAEHDAFAQSRARVYIGRQEYFDRLDAHARGDGPPLVVLGESGAGKSALLANWALRYREAHPETLVITHFIGASPYSADWAMMLRRIMGELKRRFDIRQEIPDQPDALRAAFANWLHMAGAQGRVVLIVDALNQLEDRDGAPDLIWLPPVTPANVRLILSTLPGRPLAELQRRGRPTLHVQPLDREERQRIITRYLGQYTKALPAASVERIAAATPTANPLYLRALLEELRVYGDHGTLARRIDHYLAALTVPELYERILTRYEQDYERDRPGLVRDAMVLLWAARRGLSETELLELLGSHGQALPRAHWSPLYLAAEQSLVSRSGLIGFFHDYLRQAVEDRYLPGQEERRAARLRVADYFETQDLGPRKVAELPWLFTRAEVWPRLYDLLADLSFLTAAWAADQFEVKAYWAEMERRSPLHMVDAYRPVLNTPEQHAAIVVWTVAWLLADIGHLDEAFALRTYLVAHFRRAGETTHLQAALGNQALILQARDDLDGAMALHKEQERLCRELGYKEGLQRSLGNQALILQARGDLDGAMALHKEQERLCRELGHKDGLGISLGNQALILRVRGDLDGAMALHKEKERLCRELGYKGGLQASLGNQALILQTRGDLDGAMALHKEQERLCRELGYKGGLQASLGNQALILKVRGDLDGAMALHKEQERLCRELGYKEGLQTSLGNQALILKVRGDLDGAMALYREQERLCRELGHKDGLGISLGNQALILQTRGDLDGAMALHKEQERLCRELGNPAGLARSLANQADLLTQEMGRPHDALPLVEQAYQLATDHGLTALAQQITPILNLVRSQVR